MATAILVDAYRLDRRALGRVISDECELNIVAETDDISEALALSRTYCPDYLFVTPSSDAMGTLDTLMRINCNCEKTRIVVLGTESFKPFVERAFKSGVDACICKSAGVHDIRAAFLNIKRRKRYMSDEYSRYFIENNDSKARRLLPVQRLTNRELQIMLMFVENMNVNDIAHKLCLSPKTVSTYRYRIFDKLGVRGDVALMHIAHANGLVDRSGLMTFAA